MACICYIDHMVLEGYQRSYLSKLAHHLDPVVHIGAAGVSEAVIKAVDDALSCHELIKVKFLDFKDDKTTLSQGIADNLYAQLVRVTGNIAIYYRMARLPERRQIVVPIRKKGA